MAANISVPSAQINSTTELRNTFPMVILTSLFFLWGFITCLNDILIPHLMNIFKLGYTEGMLVQFVFFTAYAVMSLPSGSLVRRIGYKHGIVLGLVVAGLGALLFYPAAGTKSYGFFLFAFFILATGITLLQVSANPYVSVLGTAETASSRLTLTQAFNSLGTTLAPIFGSILILAVAIEGASEAQHASAVQGPYLGIAAVLFLLAATIAIIKLPIISTHESANNQTDITNNIKTRPKTAWGYKHLVLGAIGIFVYVGAEVSIGSFLVKFLSLPEIGGITEKEGGKMISYYWGGAMVGRFIGAAIMQKFNPGKLLGINSLVALLLVLLTMMTSGNISMWFILSVGLFNSIMFPTIFTLAINKLGLQTAQGSGILCMAIAGGAIIPLMQGLIADSSIGLHHSFILPVLCYAYIAFYGFKGHKVI
ncbi:MAG: sugar MFS transporter [Bacteroidota bacterium]|nr:MAG: sugar MFS transporter [Bacteroidota bacterium]